MIEGSDHGATAPSRPAQRRLWGLSGPTSDFHLHKADDAAPLNVTAITVT